MFRDVPECSRMFRDVPGCSGIFHVPGFVDARSNLTDSKVELLMFPIPTLGLARENFHI